MAKLPAAARETFGVARAAKFMATRDEEGIPNIAMIASTTPWDDEHLIFGDFLMWQTKKNLQTGSPVSVSVMTRDFRCYEVRGRFLGFESSGDKFDAMGRQDMFRYSAFGMLRGVGTIAVDEIYPLKLSTSSVVKNWLLTRIGGKRPAGLPEGKRINPIVAGIFGVRDGVKFLAVARDDHMEQYPVIGMRPVGTDYLAVRSDLPLTKGDTVAISALTMDLKAFQIKGEYMGPARSRGVKLGYIRVTNVLSQTPPLVSREVPSDNYDE